MRAQHSLTRSTRLRGPLVRGCTRATVSYALLVYTPDAHSLDMATLIRSAPHVESIALAADTYQVSDDLLVRLAQQESGFNPRARSPVGAQGLMQFMPDTAKHFNVNPHDPHSSIMGAAKYISQLRTRFGNIGLALASYNWGGGNVSKWLRCVARRREDDIGTRNQCKVPTETLHYVQKLTGKPVTFWARSSRV